MPHDNLLERSTPVNVVSKTGVSRAHAHACRSISHALTLYSVRAPNKFEVARSHGRDRKHDVAPREGLSH